MTRWRADPGATSAWLEVDLGKAVRFDRARVEDDGTVAAFQIQARVGSDWQTLCQGERIGKRLGIRFAPVTAQHVRLNIESATATPSIWEFQVYPGN